jgi:hypothetical protein
MISRRALLASLAAVAAVAAVPVAPALTAREALFVAEHRWAVQALLSAIEADDFTAWIWGGAEHESPSRWRLARLMIALQTQDAPTALERRISEEVTGIWAKLTRPADPYQWRSYAGTYLDSLDA